MSRQDPPLAGVLRVVYFLCIAVVSLFAVITGVFGFYHDPDPDPGFNLAGDPFSQGFFGGGSGALESDADHFIDQAANGNVFGVQVVGDAIIYELWSGSNLYEADLPEGATIDDLLDQAGASRFDIQYIDESLANGSASSSEDGDYERNIMIILGAISAALFAAAVLGLGRRFDPLRAGLLGSGALVFLVAMIYWGDASNDWLGFVVSIAVFAVLAGTYPFLEDGLPLRETRTRPPSGGIAFTPGPTTPPQPPFVPPPPPE